MGGRSLSRVSRVSALLFSISGFLTAMRQEITRAHKGWALDGVFLDNEVTRMMKEEVSGGPSEGNNYNILTLEGPVADSGVK